MRFLTALSLAPHISISALVVRVTSVCTLVYTWMISFVVTSPSSNRGARALRSAVRDYGSLPNLLLSRLFDFPFPIRRLIRLFASPPQRLFPSSVDATLLASFAPFWLRRRFRFALAATQGARVAGFPLHIAPPPPKKKATQTGGGSRKGLNYNGEKAYS